MTVRNGMYRRLVSRKATLRAWREEFLRSQRQRHAVIRKLTQS